MHSSEYNGFTFLYNGDYSGEIRIIDEAGIEARKPFEDLVITALHDVPGLAHVQAIRTFVAFAAVHEAISRLEQMDPDDILANPWLRAILGEMTTT